MQSRTATLWSALAIVYVVWGSTYLGIRYAIGADTGEPGHPPLAMASVRFLLAGMLMFAWAVRRPAPDGRPDPLGARQWWSTAVVGAALLLGGNGLVVLAEKRGLDSYIAAVLIAMVPIWTALLGRIRGGERLPLRGVGGLALGFAGVVILVNPFSAARIDVPGALLTIGASLAWSGGSYYARNAAMPRRPLVMTAMQMMWGGLFLGLAAGVAGDWTHWRLDAGPKAWAAFAYLTVFGSIVAFTAYAWLLRNARLSLATTYAYVNPVVAVILGALLLAEPVTPRSLVASAVIVAGVALVVSARRGAGSPADVVGDEAGPGPGPDVAAGTRVAVEPHDHLQAAGGRLP